jgi:hypothetical protein
VGRASPTDTAADEVWMRGTDNLSVGAAF